LGSTAIDSIEAIATTGSIVAASTDSIEAIATTGSIVASTDSIEAIATAAEATATAAGFLTRGGIIKKTQKNTDA
jgi:hypothetical protein